jgi:site-specific DNA-methyltransferase (adenine-specific)
MHANECCGALWVSETKYDMVRIPINENRNECCLDTMFDMPDGYIDLTVTSPPYDGLRTYNGYSFDFESIAKELYRVTKNKGVLVWNISDATVNGSETGTSFKQALFFKEIGFSLYDTMIYEKASRIPTEGRYYNVIEYMFVFCKGKKPNALNFIKDHKNLTFGAIKKADKCINKGKNEKNGKTIITGEFSRRSNIWRYGTGNNDKTGHPAVMPEQLANDHIITWSNEGDIVYDPFMGSGTTAKMAIINNRKWIGSETSSEYCDIIKKRVSNVNAQLQMF